MPNALSGYEMKGVIGHGPCRVCSRAVSPDGTDALVFEIRDVDQVLTPRRREALAALWNARLQAHAHAAEAAPDLVVPLLAREANESDGTLRYALAAPPQTLEDFVRRGPTLPPRRLHTLVCRLIEALSALHERTGRMHGALSPTALVLGVPPDKAPERAPISFSGFASDAELDPAHARRQELLSFATIIAAVISRRPPAGLLAFADLEAMDFAALGGKAARWRAALSPLLDGSADLGELSKAAARLKPPPVKPRTVAISAGSTLALVGLVVGFMALRDQTQSNQQILESWLSNGWTSWQEPAPGAPPETSLMELVAPRGVDIDGAFATLKNLRVDEQLKKKLEEDNELFNTPQISLLQSLLGEAGSPTPLAQAIERAGNPRALSSRLANLTKLWNAERDLRSGAAPAQTAGSPAKPRWRFTMNKGKRDDTLRDWTVDQAGDLGALFKSLVELAVAEAKAFRITLDGDPIDPLREGLGQIGPVGKGSPERIDQLTSLPVRLAPIAGSQPSDAAASAADTTFRDLYLRWRTAAVSRALTPEMSKDVAPAESDIEPDEKPIKLPGFGSFETSLSALLAASAPASLSPSSPDLAPDAALVRAHSLAIDPASEGAPAAVAKWAKQVMAPEFSVGGRAKMAQLRAAFDAEAREIESLTPPSDQDAPALRDSLAKVRNSADLLDPATNPAYAGQGIVNDSWGTGFASAERELESLRRGIFKASLASLDVEAGALEADLASLGVTAFADRARDAVEALRELSGQGSSLTDLASARTALRTRLDVLRAALDQLKAVGPAEAPAPSAAPAAPAFERISDRWAGAMQQLDESNEVLVGTAAFARDLVNAAALAPAALDQRTELLRRGSSLFGALGKPSSAHPLVRGLARVNETAQSLPAQGPLEAAKAQALAEKALSWWAPGDAASPAASPFERRVAALCFALARTADTKQTLLLDHTAATTEQDLMASLNAALGDGAPHWESVAPRRAEIWLTDRLVAARRGADIKQSLQALRDGCAQWDPLLGVDGLKAPEPTSCIDRAQLAIESNPGLAAALLVRAAVAISLDINRNGEAVRTDLRSLGEVCAKLTTGAPAGSDTIDFWKPALESLPKALGVAARGITRADAIEKLRVMGPGSAGWTLDEQALPPELQPPFETVHYTRGTARLTFRLVVLEPVAEMKDRAAYLAATELSLQQANAALSGNADARATLSSALRLDQDKFPIRGYKLARGGDGPFFAPTEVWWNDDPAKPAPTLDQFLNSAVDPACPFSKSLQASRPTDQSPVHGVSPEAGWRLLTILGCRAPTSGEWVKAAQNHHEASPNLPDSQFACHLDFLKPFEEGLKVAGADLYFPFEGSIATLKRTFKKDVIERSRGRATEQVPLFRPSANPPDEGFVDLEGNVAELTYLTDDEANRGPQAGADQPSIGALACIGGSALVFPESITLPRDPQNFTWMSPIPLDYVGLDWDQSVSDLGVRPAFTADDVAAPPLATLLARGLSTHLVLQ